MQITIHNLETGETLTREKTSEELAQAEKDQLAYQTKKQAESKAEAARQALLDKLGITAEEAQLLLGSN